jgi:RHS repeat-associated protein
MRTAWVTSESRPPPPDAPHGIYAYTAREWDPEVGLYYYRARYYDAKIGRFISEDSVPIGSRRVKELGLFQNSWIEQQCHGAGVHAARARRACAVLRCALRIRYS